MSPSQVTKAVTAETGDVERWKTPPLRGLPPEEAAPTWAWHGQTDRRRTPGDRGVPEAKKGETIIGQGQL